MAELTINQLIKIIIGVFVFVLVIGGLYLFFNNYVLDFFKNIPGGENKSVTQGLSETKQFSLDTNTKKSKENTQDNIEDIFD